MLGSVFSLLVSWCILPYYTSQKMLKMEDDTLRNCSTMFKSIFDGIILLSNSSHSPSDIKKGLPRLNDSSEDLHTKSIEWMQTIHNDLYCFLSQIYEELNLNTIDRRQTLLAWVLLPTPKIVPLVMARLAQMTAYLREAVNIAARISIRGPPDEGFLGVLLHSREEIEKFADELEELSGICSSALNTTSKSELERLRQTLVEKIDILAVSRYQLRQKIQAWFIEHNRFDVNVENIRFAALYRLLHLVAGEIGMVGIIIGETEASLDRDYYFSWAKSWFGSRPFH